MNRPSHWILAFLVVGGGALWATGGLERILEASRSSHVTRAAASRKDVVQLNRTPPAPAYAEVRGRVVDRMGWPVVAAAVDVPGSDRAPVLTDTDGRFRLELSGAVRRALRITAPGRHDPELVRGSLDEIEVVLQDALPWTKAPEASPVTSSLLVGEGYLKDGTGAPAAHARVVVRPSGALAETDRTGRFVVPLPEGPASLVAWNAEGQVAVSDELRFARREGKVPLPDLVIRPGETVRGRMVDADGEPVSGMALVVDNIGARHLAHSAPDGSFLVHGLARGETTLTAIPDRGMLGFRKSLDVEGDAMLGDVTVARVPQQPLRVRVVDGADRGQGYVHVVAEQAEGLRRAYGLTDGAGEVALAGLAVDEATLFEVRDAGFAPVSILGYEPARHALIVSR